MCIVETSFPLKKISFQLLEEDELRNCIDSAFEKRTARKSNKISECSSDARMILNILNNLKCIVEHKVSLTAAQALGKEKILHRIWIECERLSREINAKRKAIESEENTLTEIVRQRRHSIDYSELELENLNEQCTREFNMKM